MNLSLNRLFLVIALVLFIVLAVMGIVDDTLDPKWVWGLLGSGLAAFVAGHLP